MSAVPGNYCGMRLIRIFNVFGMKLGVFMFLLGGKQFFHDNFFLLMNFKQIEMSIS